MQGKSRPSEGFVYLGTIDDVVERYPWKFKYDNKRLDHSLAVHVITGKPIILNDGYLVHHSLGREAVMREGGLLWAMIDAGFIKVMSRGGDEYGLHEMPERMNNIDSFNNLINDRIPGAPPWRRLRCRLEAIDRDLRHMGNVIRWPGYDTGSGYKILTQRLLVQGATAHSVGLGSIMVNATFRTFLNKFIDTINKDTSGPRNKWEDLAKEMSREPGATSNQVVFVRSLMNLANEMYHYNMGVMLASVHEGPVSVETQASAAFDDLLVQKDVLVEEMTSMPELRVPRVVAEAPPNELVKVLRTDLDYDVAKSRSEWMELKNKYEYGEQPLSSQDINTINDAAAKYAHDLSEFLHINIKYRKTESLFSHVVGETVKKPSRIAASLAGEAVSSSLGVPPGVGTVAGFATGYAISQLRDRGVGVASRKYRILLLKNQILPPEVIRRSASAISRIKRSRTPSSIDIKKSIAYDLSSKMSKFEP